MLQSMGVQRVGHDGATELNRNIHYQHIKNFCNEIN